MKKIFAAFLISLLFSSTALAYDTYYVRSDGGTQDECTGLADAAYDGSGTGEACAFSHHFEAVGVGGATSQVISAGDRVIIRNESYRTGYTAGVYDTTTAYDKCETAYPYECDAADLPDATDYWVTNISTDNPAVVTVEGTHGFANGEEVYIDFVMKQGNLDKVSMSEINNEFYTIANATSTTFEITGVDGSSLPTMIGTFGIATQPTVIAGEDWRTGCADRPELYLVERARAAFHTGDNTHIRCLEITDHETCFEFGGESNCERDGYPDGDWGQIGLIMYDDRNPVVQDVYLKGLAADACVRYGRNHNFRFKNSYAIGCEQGLIAGSGTSFQVTGEMWIDFSHSWVNGCQWDHLTGTVTGCCKQSDGCISDGFSSPEVGTSPIIVHGGSSLMNTHDGLDLLYNDTGTIGIFRHISGGNNGNQVKGAYNTYMQNNIFFGNCSAPFDDEEYAYNMDNFCRSSETVWWGVLRSGNTGTNAYFDHNTVLGVEQAYAIYVKGEGGDDCDGTETFYSNNNIFQGEPKYNDQTQVNHIAVEDGNCTTNGFNGLVQEYSIIDSMADNESTCSGTSLCEDPLLEFTFDVENVNFKPSITISSSAYNPSSTGTVTFWDDNTDFNGNAPIGTRDWGALEYGSTGYDFTEFLTYLTAEQAAEFMKRFGTFYGSH